MAQQLFHEYGLYPIHAAAALATAAKFAILSVASREFPPAIKIGIVA